MKLVETELTPELAARLLADAHSNQRRTARAVVALYARIMKEGRWRLVPDPILVDPDGHMFNGGHRCAAVIAAHTTIPVMICWDADPSTFDVIDVGRKRGAYQFIGAASANARASAARVTLWYTHRFDRPLQPIHLDFDLHEVLEEVEARATAFDAMLPSASSTYEYTGLARSVCLGAYAIAFGFGYQDEVEAFVRGVEDPTGLQTGDPARLLADRFRKVQHRGRRRQPIEDWTLLVRALNLHLEGKLIRQLQLTDVWPHVGESSKDYDLRRNAVSEANRRGRLHADAHGKTDAIGATETPRKAPARPSAGPRNQNEMATL